MGVPTEVGEDLLRPSEGALGVDHPVLGEQPPPQLRPGSVVLQVRRQSKPPSPPKSLQSGLDARDTDGLRQIGHTLAGSFMGLIRPELLEQAQAVEDSAAAALEGHAAVDVAVERAQTLLEGLEALDREVRAYLESAEAQRLT